MLQVLYMLVNHRNHLELCALRGCVCLRGCALEDIAERDATLVPPSFVKKRIARDGSLNVDHHVTFLAKFEVDQILRSPLASKIFVDKSDRAHPSTLADLVTWLRPQISFDVVDLGLGFASSGGNRSYFRVLSWPSAHATRRRLSDFGVLSKDFHLTLGFSPNDPHGPNKVGA